MRCGRIGIHRDNSRHPGNPQQDGPRIQVLASRNDATNTDVVLYDVQGGGHTWPGGWQYLGVWLVGKTSREINASDLMWEFFKNHKLQ